MCQRSSWMSWIRVIYVLGDGLFGILCASLPTKRLWLYLSKLPPVFCLTFIYVSGRALIYTHHEVSFQTVSLSLMVLPVFICCKITHTHAINGVKAVRFPEKLLSQVNQVKPDTLYLKSWKSSILLDKYCAQTVYKIGGTLIFLITSVYYCIVKCQVLELYFSLAFSPFN